MGIEDLFNEINNPDNKDNGGGKTPYTEGHWLSLNKKIRPSQHLGETEEEFKKREEEFYHTLYKDLYDKITHHPNPQIRQSLSKTFIDQALAKEGLEKISKETNVTTEESLEPLLAKMDRLEKRITELRIINLFIDQILPKLTNYQDLNLNDSAIFQFLQKELNISSYSVKEIIEYLDTVQQNIKDKVQDYETQMELFQNTYDMKPLPGKENQN